MIGGMHTVLYSKNAEAVRKFFRDVLKFPSVDAGGGWLIFAAPPSELAVHPSDVRGGPELYLMCEDIESTVRHLMDRGVEFTRPITGQSWGLVTQFKLPDGETIGLYQPRHATAVKMAGASKTRKSIGSKKTKKSKSVADNRK